MANPCRVWHSVVLFPILLAACDSTVPFSEWEWQAVQSLGGLPEPEPDLSNAYVGNAAAEALGQKFYFDPAFSGVTLAKDMLYRDVPFARAAAGEEAGISCATCHDPARAGSDFTSVPRHVSIGGGAYDVNSQQVLNAAYYPLIYWNGRSDSLWSQVVAVAESEVSMAGDRMEIVWRVVDAYRSEYNAIFGAKYPIPAQLDSIAAQQARLNADGTCKLVDAACPTTHCREVANDDGQMFCLPRFPLRGRPGYEGREGVVEEGVQRFCQRGQETYPEEPFDDAYDCMDIFDQRAVMRIYVNWAKAIAAYEYRLVSRNSAFDRFVAEGPESTAISPAAKRGAKLFVGKASCIDCHNTPLLSDGQFHNIGIPQVGQFIPSLDDCPEGGWCDCVSDDVSDPQNCLPAGYREGLRRLQANTFRRDSFWSDDTDCQGKASLHTDPLYLRDHQDECQGRARFYAKLIDTTVPKASYVGQWKTPSLRDVAKTGPYMHNGMYETLEEVIWHYDRGGEVVGVPGVRDPRLRPLDLTDAEISDIIAFLGTLDGEPLPTELVTAPALP